jgi:hypothetical protein
MRTALARSIVLVLPFAAACSTGVALQEMQQRVDERFVGKPIGQALTELGPPVRERPINDLRSYAWDTGWVGEPGGECLLRLVADRKGIVVDYRLDGTVRGCRRLVGGGGT